MDESAAASAIAPGLEGIAERTRTFMLYTFLEQERKLHASVLNMRRIVRNNIQLWYSYQSQFTAKTLAVRLPLWCYCSLWTAWDPSLDTAALLRIKPSPDTHGAELALVAALHMPDGVTPARHITGVVRWMRELLEQWSLERAALLERYNVETPWAELEVALVEFYAARLRALMAGDWTATVWGYFPAITAVRPDEMPREQQSQYVLGLPIGK